MLLKIIILFSSFVFISNTFAMSSEVRPENCASERVKLQILRTRGPELLDDQASTGYLIWLDDKAHCTRYY